MSKNWDSPLTWDEFQTLTTAATYLVNSGGKLDEMLFVLFNQVVNECKSANLNPTELLTAIRDDLNLRINGPQTPDEFNALYGSDDN